MSIASSIASWNPTIFGLRVELLFIFVGFISVILKSRNVLLGLFFAVGAVVFFDQLYHLWHPQLFGSVPLEALGYSPNFISIILKLIISFYCLVFGASVLAIDNEKVDNEFITFFLISATVACFAVSTTQVFVQALSLETLFLINIYFISGWTRKKQILTAQSIDTVFVMIKSASIGFFLWVAAVTMLCVVAKSEDFSEIQSYLVASNGLGSHLVFFNLGLSIYILTVLQKMGLGFFSGALLNRLRTAGGICFFPTILFTVLTPFLALLQFVVSAIARKTEGNWSYISQAPLPKLFFVIGLVGLVIASFASLVQKNIRSSVGLFVLANLSVVLMLLADLSAARLVVAALWILELGMALVVISNLQQMNQWFNKSWLVALVLLVMLFDFVGTVPFVVLSYRSMAFFELIKQGQLLVVSVYLISILLLTIAVLKLVRPIIGRTSVSKQTIDDGTRPVQGGLVVDLLVFVLCILPIGLFRIFWTAIHDVVQQCVRVFG